MFSTCIFCNKPLGQNESLEAFPVGERIAFDAARGRLWVVCRACERWNLSPLDERWEAIDQAEKLYRDTRRRVSTDNIGLAKLREGTTLVRIGSCMAPEFPPRSVKELVDYVKKNPGKVTFGSAGVGSSVHMMGELFAHAAGIKMTHIPFKGGGNGITDLLGGHVSIVMSSLAAAGPLINSGKLRALVAFDNQRYPTFPQVPAVTEDLPQFDPPVIWYGLAGPAGLPQPITEQLNREAQKAMATPDLKKEIIAGAYKVIGGSPRDYQELMRRDIKSMGDIVKAAGIKLE